MHRSPISSLFEMLSHGNMLYLIIVVGVIGFGISMLVQNLKADRIHSHIESRGGRVLDVKSKPARYHRVLRNGKWVREEVHGVDEFTVHYVDSQGNERVADSSVSLIGDVDIERDAISKVSNRSERKLEARIESLERENANLRERVMKLQESIQSEWKPTEPPPPEDPRERKDT